MNFDFYRVVAGQKLLCKEDGTLLKDDSDSFMRVKDAEEADEEDLEEVEPDEDAGEEVEQMLEEARTEVKQKAKKDAEKATVEARTAVTNFMNSIKDEVSETGISNKGKGDQLATSFDPDHVKNQIEAFNKGRAQSVAFNIRDASEAKALLSDETRQKTTSGADLTNDVIEGERVPEISRDPVRQRFVEGIADVTPNMESDHLSYVEATNESGAPATTAELNNAPEKDFEFTEFKAYLKKIMVTNKHSVEILQDSAQLVSALRGWLNEDVNLETDDQLLNGSGTGSDLEGVFTVASVVDNNSLGSKEIETPNLYDVLRVAMTQMMTDGNGKFRPTHVLLNPDDSDELDLTKDADGRYIIPPFRSEDGLRIKGATVIENTGVPQGDFLVGDFNRLHVGTKGGVQVEMTNSDGDDFGKDILTVKLRRRISSYVRNNDSAAFQTGTISDVKVALNPNSS